MMTYLLMAIAFVSAADLGNNGGSTSSLTQAFTVSAGSDRLLVVSLWGSTGTDVITGVTYNGTALTNIHKILGGRWLHMWYLLNPSSGSNNVVISASGNDWIGATVGEWTGVAQSGQPDAAAEDADSDASVTTVADNCWAILAGYANNTIAASTGTTERARSDAFDNGILGDSNGPITPAGAYSMAITGGGGANAVIVASFSPAGGAATAFPWHYYQQMQAMMG